MIYIGRSLTATQNEEQHKMDRSEMLKRVEKYIAQYPDGNPKTILGQAKPRMSDTPTQSVRLLGQVHTMGAEKYGAFNWREHNVSSTVYYDAAMRHLMAYFDGENLDAESGLPHLAHVMACASILIDAKHHGTLNDNRPVTELAE